MFLSVAERDLRVEGAVWGHLCIIWLGLPWGWTTNWTAYIVGNYGFRVLEAKRSEIKVSVGPCSFVSSYFWWFSGYLWSSLAYKWFTPILCLPLAILPEPLHTIIRLCVSVSKLLLLIRTSGIVDQDLLYGSHLNVTKSSKNLSPNKITSWVTRG